VNLPDLTELLKREPKYRTNQINKLLFQDLIESWEAATILPQSLRKTLNQKFPLEINATQFHSKKDQTVKALFTLVDGQKVEAVLMAHQSGRNTVCVSSQVGCPLGCLFCATGYLGFKRNLTSSEIISQVLYFARYLKKSDQKVANIVLMGMGEPFLNYEAVLLAVRQLNDKNKFNIGARHISISTAGLPAGIQKLSEEELEVNLAVSLHAPDNILRSKLMSINQKYPIEKVLDSVEAYTGKTGRKVMFEYILLDHVNDGVGEASKLAKILKKRLFHLNLITYNPTGKFKPSSPKRFKLFKEALTNLGLPFTQRYRFGTDIEAACGQLALKTPRN